MIWVICGLSSAQRHSYLWCLVYDNAPGVQALRTDYLQRYCHLAFGCIIKMGWTVYVCYHVSPCASSVLSVIYDFRGEWTSVVSPFWLFWADLVWVGHGGHKASGDLKIHGYSLTCTSASALEEHLYLQKNGVQFLHKDTLSHRERMRSVYSLPHNAENPSLKGGLKCSLGGQSTCIKYIVKFHVSNTLK